MISSKHLIFCDGGLGNRIRGIINALGWFEPANLEIIWPKNNWCEASFDEIFDTRNLNFRESNFGEIKKQLGARKFLLFAHENQFECPADLFIDIKKLKKPKTAILRAISKKKINTIIHTAEFHPSLTLNDILSACGFLKWNSKASEEATSFARSQGLLRGSYQGLHIRLTDSGYHLREFRKFIQARDQIKEKKLICTDDYTTALKLIQNKPCFIIRKPKAEPKKYINGSGWRDKIQYSDGRSFGFNVRRSRKAIMEAVTDLILLSGSKIIPTKLSSFSEVAGYLGYRHQTLHMKAYLFQRRCIQKIKLLLVRIKPF